ncbi:hypothetical protein F4V57_07955 [Acinetobacter qingfengensis]|uniref:Uncharacterized protein n=1 Tax=Acinetobacter qingfengensis TaxID=1262585 RepID=A0A1E7QZ19_9GAMM|nr:hypothetical protein [Acinetobacter qingfengensis]KAA8733154.1 hypothetical protein F4V57_07955 [Acinetobacter qingfengensis]OEY92304.1 hypothetical protein BJI46_06050 [Acinetobacter qingfengensis]
MALNIGDNFKQRWLATPEAIRHSYCDELRHICALLEPETQLQKWQYQEAVLQQRQRQITEQAYQQLKKQILAEQARLAEERKRQRQAELEQILAEKRAEQQAELLKLEQQEQLKLKEQDAYLKQLAQELQQQSLAINQQPIAKFDVNQVKQFNVVSEQSTGKYLATTIHDCNNSQIATAIAATDLSPSTSSLNDDLKIRLELEAEYYIEQTLLHLREKLQAAAREEIEIILATQQNQ